MGIWANTTLSNDDALDWLSYFKESRTPDVYIKETLKNYLNFFNINRGKKDLYSNVVVINGDEKSGNHIWTALAACELLTAQLGRPSKEFIYYCNTQKRDDFIIEDHVLRMKLKALIPVALKVIDAAKNSLDRDFKGSLNHLSRRLRKEQVIDFLFQPFRQMQVCSNV